MSEEAKKRLKDLAKQVRDKVNTHGASVLHQRGIDLVDEIAKELASPDGIPGLRVWRDGPTKMRLTRPNRNAEITVEWERDVQAIAMTLEKHGEPKTFVRYVWDEAKKHWRKLDGGGELWDDLTSGLVEYLYPEGKK
jgi:hypothetical protein